MKYNKGFALIALIAIIAGVLVIGSGAYYLGKKSNTKNFPEGCGFNGELCIKDKNVMNNMQQDCLSTTTPWLKVISPNGGETYTAGQQITVKWESCNIGGHPIGVVLNKANMNWDDGNPIVFATGAPEDSTPNDGIETFTIPASVNPEQYKIGIQRDNSNYEDSSDNSFTIITTNFGGTTKKINWLKSPKFNLYYQDNFNIIEYYADITGKNVSEMEGVPFLHAILKTNSDVGISWGGYWNNNKTTCTSSDFGIFRYGVSNLACVKGYRASIGHFSARAVLSQEELNIFGDFVLKN